MKRIVLCFDGTWNKPADENLPAVQQVETNVRRFYESLKDTGTDGARQLKWYDEGVGTHWYDQFIGGAIGTGLEVNIVQGYQFLAENYEDGDQVFIVGFSRGAYTARSLVGMVRNCGLVEPKYLALRVGIAYGIYRTRDDGPDSMTAKLFRSSFCRDIRIKFIGVWDTVGALGIPSDLVKSLNMKFYEFHDTELSGLRDLEPDTSCDGHHVRPLGVRRPEVEQVLSLEVQGVGVAVLGHVVPVHFHQREDAVEDAVVEMGAQEERLAPLIVQAEAVAERLGPSQ